MGGSAVRPNSCMQVRSAGLKFNALVCIKPVFVMRGTLARGERTVLHIKCHCKEKATHGQLGWRLSCVNESLTHCCYSCILCHTTTRCFFIKPDFFCCLICVRLCFPYFEARSLSKAVSSATSKTSARRRHKVELMQRTA